MKQIDARGMDCPEPVLRTRALVEGESPVALEVVVDNEAAKQNVTRYLESQAYETGVTRVGDLFHVTGINDIEATMDGPEPEPEPEAQGELKIMVMVSSDRIGRGDDTLGKKLMVNFIKTINEIGDDLWRVAFVNSGVKLTIDESDVLEELNALERQGILMLVCGTCLDHFNLLDRKKAGETTNMLDLVTAMHLADKVITV